jgi:16S rRNA (cytidine1402-2'-O)-methyltransferase
MVQAVYSFQHPGKGVLYLCATPIGNLSDMTLRGLEVLRNVDIIAAEDTRQTRKLLSHFGISGPELVRYHEHNAHTQGIKLIRDMTEGKTVALVTDAGTPAISDPGEELVIQATENGIPVIAVPGPCAAVQALIVSGLPTGRFTFLGFLPRRSTERRKALQMWKDRQETLVLYEAPHRLSATLRDLREVFGLRRACLARELTKMYEQVIRGTLEELVEWAQSETVRGEMVIVVEGDSGTERASFGGGSPAEWVRFVDERIRSGATKKEALKEAAVRFHIPKREIYKVYLDRGEE